MKRFLFAITALLLALCFAVPAFAENKQSKLAYNGDFELYGEGDLFPDGWSFHSYEAEYKDNYDNASAEVVEEEGRGHVLHISVTEDDDAAVYQTIDVQPNTLYKLSCMIRTDSVENGQGANVALREIVAASEGVFGTSDWRLVELVGKTGPVQDYIVVSCRLGGYGMVSHGEAWFDDFNVEKLASYDGDIIPFYDGETTEDEDGKDTSSWVVPVIIGVFALAVIVGAFFLIRGSKKDGGSGEDPTAGSGEKTRSKHKTERMDDLLNDPHPSFFRIGGELPGPTDNKLHFTNKDRIFVLVVTLVYAAFGLFRLGTMKFPTSSLCMDTGDSVRIEFGRPVKISEIWQNSGISFINYKLVTDNGEEIAMEQKSRTEYGNMFRWAKLSASDIRNATETTSLTLTVMGGDTGRRKEADLVLNELAVFDENNERVLCSAPGAEALFDEQDTVPDYPSYYTGMYFDELYHGRTALEHIQNLHVYEWTHPPLGKLIIAVGILIFGMVPFGWRIMGTVFGIAMVPIMYCFGKRILKRSEYALFSTVLFTFDFMHLTMMRIATVDTFAVFFILLMTYYMYQFISMDIGDDPKKFLKPLALSGIFFGLGCASKWICMYTGAGLAVLFFVKLVLMGIKSSRLSKLPKYSELKLNKKFRRTAAMLVCWCLIFFVIVPVVIYGASYFRYYTAQWLPQRQAQIYSADTASYASADDVKLGFGDAVSTYVKGVIKNQGDMFNYHSTLKSDHSAASSWWMWLLDMRPTWFYVGGYGNPNGNVGTISAFGNPATWIFCTVAAVALIIVLIIKRRLPLEEWFIFVCLGSSFLPWVLVPRSTYAYHFYASVPFITLAAGRLIMYWEEKDDKKRADKGQKGRSGVRSIKWIWIGLALLLFVVFYPVISGLEVPREYIGALQWFPFHKWQVQDQSGEVLKNYRIGWRFLDYEPVNPPTTIIVK